MSENIIELPYKYYPDPKKGKPVYLGYIYIGEPNTDPEVLINQKQVTMSENCSCSTGGTPIAQPIRTSAGGVPEFNGSPIALFTDGNYSIKVLNSKGDQVYYSGSVENNDNVLNFATLAGAVENTSAKSGDSASLVDRTAGNGGGAMWDYVLASSVTVNGIDIVACTGVPTLALVLRVNANTTVDQLGASSLSDSSAAVSRLKELQKSFNVGLGDYRLDAPLVVGNFEGVRGESYTQSTLTFPNSNGLDFEGERTELSKLKLIGTKDAVVIDPESGVNGKIGITHQVTTTANSGRAIMSNLQVEGWNTGYAEVTDGTIWTGAYRKMSDAEIHSCDMGMSFIGGATDFRAVNLDIRNCPSGGVHSVCVLDSQYSNIRLTNALVETCGSTGQLAGKAKESGIYAGLNTQISLVNGYLENTSVSTGYGGSVDLDLSYKAFPVRVYGLGRIGITGNYDTYELNISQDITTWSAANATVTDMGVSGDEFAKSYKIESTGAGSIQITSPYDDDIMRKISATTDSQAFLLISMKTRVDDKPTGNYFGPFLRAGMIATDVSTFTNTNGGLDLDPDILLEVDGRWQYVNYIVPIRFGAGGLTEGEFLRSIRLQTLFTDTPYTVVTDGAITVYVKDVKATVYVPK